MTGPYTFKKKERLTQNLLIDRLFNDSSSFNLSPFKVFYLKHPHPDEFDARILIAVSRRKFRRAVDRNRIKRLVREAYRLNKQPLLDQLHAVSVKMYIGFVFIGNSPDMAFDEVEKKVKLCLDKLMQLLKEDSKKEGSCKSGLLCGGAEESA
jgi:ribonuclease P protein component